MADDFRVTVAFQEPSALGWLAERLAEHSIEEDVRTRLGDRISVSGEGAHLFLYADSAEAAAEAEQVVRSIVAQRGFVADYALDRWHPLEERWEAAAHPLPVTEAAREAERERHDADEEAQSESSGYADWEVRVDLPSHHEAVALAERLEADGQTPIRRWKYVIVGANTEDGARELARSIETDAAGGKVTIEPALGMLQGTFAFFGPG